MLSELQVQNIGGVFDVLDHDKDGDIEREDFESVAGDVIRGIVLAEDSPHRKSVLEGYLGWWEQIRAQADTDNDGKVSRDEYITAVDQGLLEDPNYLDGVGAAADALFAAADKNGDGTLGEVEIVSVYVAVGVSADVAAGAFEQIDADGDGKISGDEFRAAVHGVFASKGPEEIGSNMLGNV